MRLKVQTLLGQFPFEFWTPVVSVCQYGSCSSIDQFSGNSGLMDMGWCYAKADDDAGPGPGHQSVQPKAVEGLARNPVASEASLTAEALTSVCAGELTDRDGETVN